MKIATDTLRAAGPFARLPRESLEALAETAVRALGLSPWDSLHPREAEEAAKEAAWELRRRVEDAEDAAQELRRQVEDAENDLERYMGGVGKRIVDALAALLDDPELAPGARRALEFIAAEVWALRCIARRAANSLAAAT